MAKHGAKRPQATIPIAVHQLELGRQRRQFEVVIESAYCHGRREVVDRIDAAIGGSLGIDRSLESTEGRLRRLLTAAVAAIDTQRERRKS